MTTTPEPQLTETDERAIRDLVQRAHDAQNDATVLPSLHDQEAIIVNIAGRRLFGRDDFASAMGAALESSLGDVTTTVEIVDVRPIAGDVAVVSSVKAVHDARAGHEDDLPESGAFTYVVKRAGDAWRIALAQTTPIVGA